MSANNIWLATEIDGKWYGWDETVETVMSDRKEKDHYVRKLHLVRAVTAPTIQKLQKKLGNRMLGYAEYGLQIINNDGTSFIDDSRLEIVI